MPNTYVRKADREWEAQMKKSLKTLYDICDDSTATPETKLGAIKQLKPNAWGIYDMLGNVAEWTLDQYHADYFERIKSKTNNPWLEPISTHPLTLKGGHFRDEATALRSAARLPSNLKWNERDPQIPKSKWWNADAPFIGFRIVRPLQQPSKEDADRFFSKLLNLE